MSKNQLLLKKLLSGLGLMVVFFITFIGLPVSAQVTSQNAATFGGNDQKAATQEAIGVIGKSTADPRTIAANIINVLFGFLGLITVSLILYGGWLWMTSGGNPEKIQHAKDVLKNTAIGLLIIFSAWAIVTFIINFFFQGSGDVDGGGGGAGRRGAGIGALGTGIIETLYPEPNQTGVARNTGIIVTFREPIDASTICATTSKTLCAGEDIVQSVVRAGVSAPNIRIYKTSDAENCEKEGLVSSSSCRWSEAAVYSTDGKTFIFKPKNYLGSPTELIWHTVYLTSYLKKLSGENAFRSYDGVRDQSWSFEVSSKIDLTPPEVVFGETFPAPDNARDDEGLVGLATSSKGSISVLSSSLIPTATAKALSATQIAPPLQNDVTATVSTDCSDTEFKVTINNAYAAITKQVDGQTTEVGGSSKLSTDNKCLIFNVCNLNLCLLNDHFKSDLKGYTSSEAKTISGNQWKITVAPATEGDWVQIGNDRYSPTNGPQDSLNRLFKIESTQGLTAKNLVEAITAQVDAAYAAKLNGTIVNIESRAASSEANNIELSTSNQSKLSISASTLSGGQSYAMATSIKGRKDKPMNSMIQINFNEAINPLTVAGQSSKVGDYIKVINASAAAKVKGSACIKDNECISLMCDAISKKCVGDYLDGIFKISNVYKTLEFRSNNECGVNGCGEKIYCLPAQANVKIWLKTPELDTCTGAEVDNQACSTRVPFRNCSNRPTGNMSSSTVKTTCQDISSSTNVINYPLALPNILSADSGLMDSAFNALNGNRDGSSNGPVNDYTDNQITGYCAPTSPRHDLACTADNQVAICGLGERCLKAPTANVDTLSDAQKFGDNYFFTFWTSNELKINPPVINKLDDNTAINAISVKLTDKIVSKFSEVMMSSTLTTGTRDVVTSTSTVISHKLLNIGSYSGAAVGYWGKSWPQDPNMDGEPDSTWAEVAHTEFDQSMKYWAQNGSGINDIYQNCFKPSDGPGVSGASCGVTASQPSCVDGAPSVDYKH